jgi:hypothetical protein
MIHHPFNPVQRYLLASILALACVQAHAQEPNADIYGKWKIKALIGGGAISSRSQSQVEKVIGQFTTISREQFDFDNHRCTHPDYQRHQEETASYFDAGWRADVSDIPLPNPVTIIETGCTTFLYPIRKDHLMIADDGDFFEAVRVTSSPRKATRPVHR